MRYCRRYYNELKNRLEFDFFVGPEGACSPNENAVFHLTNRLLNMVINNVPGTSLLVPSNYSNTSVGNYKGFKILENSIMA